MDNNMLSMRLIFFITIFVALNSSSYGSNNDSSIQEYLNVGNLVFKVSSNNLIHYQNSFVIKEADNEKDTTKKFVIEVPKGIKYAKNLSNERYYYFYKDAQLIMILFDAKKNKLLNNITDSIYNLDLDNIYRISAYYLDKFYDRNNGFKYKLKERNIHSKKRIFRMYSIGENSLILFNVKSKYLEKYVKSIHSFREEKK